jgi:hypothetical protein
VPPERPDGDQAGFFIEAIRSRHLGDDLFSTRKSSE